MTSILAPIDRELLHCICPLLEQSGHSSCIQRCPLLGVKRTSDLSDLMSVRQRGAVHGVVPTWDQRANPRIPKPQPAPRCHSKNEASGVSVPATRRWLVI